MNQPAHSSQPRVTLIPGDDIGPEVTAATLRLLEVAGAQIEWIERKGSASTDEFTRAVIGALQAYGSS